MLPYDLVYFSRMKEHTVKWGDIEQQGDIEQSYLFHGNSLISVYNNHFASCLCFRLVTEGFCSPPLHLQQFSKCLHMTFDLLFCPNNFQTKKFDVLRQSFDRKLISPNVSRDIQKPLIDLCMSQIVSYCSGRRNLNKLARKSLFFQSHPILMG